MPCNEHYYSTWSILDGAADALQERGLIRMNMSENRVSDAPTNEESAAQRLRAIYDVVHRCERLAGRPSGAVTLTAVTKQRSVEQISALIFAGQTTFGENRVQEAKQKWPALKAAHPDLKLRLIGPLQTNKVRDACSLFDAIETLDREPLAEALAKEFSRSGVSCEVYVQVNVGDEPQKSGVALGDADRFIERCIKEFGITVAGLMCIPPVGRQASPYFALLAAIASRHGIAGLSMGMSADYELAIQLGATRVRIGSALFADS